MKNVQGLFGRLLLLLVIFGVVFTYIGGVDLMDSRKPRYALSGLMESDFKKGMIIEGEIYANLGAFQESYTTTNGVKTGSSDYSYMIPVGETQYAGFEAKFDDTIQALDRQTDAVFLVLSGEGSEDPEPVTVLGKVKKMPKKTRGYLRSYMLDLGFAEQEVDSYILDYYIVQTSFDSALGFLLAGIGMLAVSIAVIVVLALKSKKESEVRMPAVMGNDLADMPSSAFAEISAGTETAEAEHAQPVEPDEPAWSFEPESPQTNYGSGLGEGIRQEPKTGSGLKLKDH